MGHVGDQVGLEPLAAQTFIHGGAHALADAVQILPLLPQGAPEFFGRNPDAQIPLGHLAGNQPQLVQPGKEPAQHRQQQHLCPQPEKQEKEFVGSKGEQCKDSFAQQHADAAHHGDPDQRQRGKGIPQPAAEAPHQPPDPAQYRTAQTVAEQHPCPGTGADPHKGIGEEQERPPQTQQPERSAQNILRPVGHQA